MGLPGTSIFVFGEWRLDVTGHLLLRHGEPVSLTPKVFDTLVVLVENAGKLVPKDEFFRRVWPDAFVEESVLSQNISVLRKTLNGGNALLIETVPKLGYRFVATVRVVADQQVVNEGLQATPDPVNEKHPEDPDVHSHSGFGKVTVALIGVAIFVLANISLQWVSQPTEPRVLRYSALTSSGRADPWGGITIDGSRVYFLGRQGGRFQLMQTSVVGGEETPVAAPYPNTRIFRLSPDGSQFLIGNFAKVGGPMPLSTWPAQGGAPHRIGDIMVNDAVWFPDGKHILYSYNQGVFSVEADGANARHLFDVSGSAADFSWRPDGSVFRFTVFDDKGGFSLWESSPQEASQHPLFPTWADAEGECCGSWMPDGRNYVFSAFRNEVEDLWVLPEPEGLFWWRKRTPVRLTSGPVGWSSPVPDKDGKRLFALGLQYSHSAFRFDPLQQIFLPFLSSKPKFDFAFSRDGKWVAYVGEREALWRSRVDGSEALQLTSGPIEAMRPRWSPDGTHILFMGYKADTTSTPYIIRFNGGTIAPLVKEGTGNFAQADWSPDGNSIVFDAVSESGPQEGISVKDLHTHNQTLLAESKGKDYVRWSPDGRYLAADPKTKRNYSCSTSVPRNGNVLRLRSIYVAMSGTRTAATSISKTHSLPLKPYFA